jgi:hypothetical protein
MDLQFSFFENQRKALRYLRDSKTNEVLYGGGARGGKSWFGCSWVIMEAISKPESAWLIAREELTKLRDTTYLTFFKVANVIGLKKDVHYFVNSQTFTITFYNGSVIFFRELKYLPSDPEFDRIGSYDLTGAFIDESQQIHFKAVNVLRGRFSVLSGKGWKTIPKTLYTCNPAKNWIYTEFVKPEKENKLRSDRQFIKSLATDNPYVDEAYIENLRKSDKVTIERLLNGNFEYDDDPARLIEYDCIVDIWSNYFVEKGKKYITADIARYGSDKAVIKVWDGFRVVKITSFEKSSITLLSDTIKKLSYEFHVPMSQTVCDEDGVGGGVVDILGCKGFVNNAKPFEESSKNPNDDEKKPQYQNLKSQCYFKLADLINNNGLWICETEYKDQIIEELEQVKRHNIDKDGKLAVIPKEKVKELLGRSPDFSDALMMRMYFELEPKQEVFVF